MNPTLTVEDLRFELRLSRRRHTLGLTVDRGGELIIHAPEGSSSAVVEAFVREKRLWVYTKLAEKKALSRTVQAKEYVDGEGFWYLGRTYRLLLVPGQAAALRLDHGRFKLLRAEADRGRSHFINWYACHGRAWLRRRVEAYVGRVGVAADGVEVRDLGHRWGSCGKRGVVNFHWATILLPPSVADYVVVHELVHLRAAHHTPEFWRRVERVFPDYEERRRWLAENGGAFTVL